MSDEPHNSLNPAPSSTGDSATSNPGAAFERAAAAEAGVIAAATASTWLDAALKWSQIANIVPIRKGEKQPGITAWEKLGRVSEAQIRAWDASGLYGGIGIRPGAQSGNAVIIDFDGMAAYEAFAAAHPEDAETYTEMSGSGKGMHTLFYVDDLPQRRTTKLKRSVIIGEQVVGIEIFYDSGQVVVAPSIHPSGNPYRMTKALPIRRLPNIQHIIDWIEALPSPQKPVIASAEPQREAVPTKPGAHRAYALKALDNMAGDVARLNDTENDFQNDTCYLNTWKLAHFAARGDLSRSEIFAALESAMRSNGYIAAFGYHAFSKTFESGYSSGYGDNAYVPKCYQAPESKPVRIAIRDQHIDRPLDYAQDITPLTLRRAGRLMAICPEYVLIELHTLALGIEKNFTAAELMESIGCSPATAQRIIDRALFWGLVSERFANLQTIDSANKSILCKNEKRQIRGAAKARHYCLSPVRAEHEIARRLPDHVQELQEWGDPDVIRRDEAEAAGAADPLALEQITTEIARSMEAFEVIADAERRAKRKADELTWFAESDETPFTPDVLPSSVTELRVQLLEALIATRPDAEWRHGELMWVAGVKRGSVSKLIAKSKFKPAEAPTYVDVPVDGKDLHRAVRVQCREKGGAPVAWLDGKGTVISSFSRSIPAGAKGVKLNIGKIYERREAAAVIGDHSEVAPVNEPVSNHVEVPPTEAEVAESTAKRLTARARRGLLPKMLGCVKARGWHVVSGPYGGIERGGVTHPLTFEGMEAALLDDEAWMHDLRAARLLNDPLVLVGIELGAEVTAL